MKKFFVSIIILALCFLLVGCAEVIKTKDGKRLKLVGAEQTKIEFEEYDNGLISMNIPKGWKVEIPKCSYSNYGFKLYNPDNKDYMILFALKLSGFLKSEKARAKFAKMYPSAAFGKLAAIDPQTTEAFYKVWNKNAKVTNEEELKTEYFPYLNNFTVVQNLGKIEKLGGDILRATFTNAKGELQQGLFTTTIYSGGKYIMNGYDFAPLNAYHTVMMMAPDVEFPNYQEAYDKVLGSITFSEKFMNGFLKEESTIVSTVQANQKIYDEISDMIMDSWNKRNTSYDVISQKRSDATLGYERVYNTDTNEVYRVYNGFTEEYDGTKYKPITDDMYTTTISGYIEK